MDPIISMLEELLPDKSPEERQELLWCCTCFPFAGGDEAALKRYREQLDECLRERPDDPMSWALDQTDKAFSEWKKSREPLEVAAKLMEVSPYRLEVDVKDDD